MSTHSRENFFVTQINTFWNKMRDVNQSHFWSWSHFKFYTGILGCEGVPLKAPPQLTKSDHSRPVRPKNPTESTKSDQIRPVGLGWIRTARGPGGGGGS